MFAGSVVESSGNGWTFPMLKEMMLTASHRDTVVVRAQVKSSELRNQTVVVEWGSVPRARNREAHIIDRARRHTEGSRPEIPCHPQHAADNGTPKCLKALLGNFTPAEHEDGERRVLRILVQQELKPITKLTDADELARVFKEIVECHHWLYETAKILHRDISLSSLMFQRIDGTVYGVLNDFDLANLHGRSKSPSSKQRTGTRAYMAIDLLVSNPPEHLYRHDLESFLYVLVFLACEIEGSRFADWHTLEMDSLSDCKFMATNNGGFPPQKKNFAKFDLWVVLLDDLFHGGREERRVYRKEKRQAVIRGASKPAPFDDVSLGGTVTFDTFGAILISENLEADTQEDKEKVQAPK
ncbi:hypothetical protein DFH06DRAFT_1078682 [Mycena polygramma]|nr:hypothetical protein DFH06DRAFT_1078682 [Mycena polygramma]